MNKTNCPSCEPCKDYCKHTIMAECVKNLELLKLINGNNQRSLQKLLVTINNSLRSISEMDCFSYTRTVDPETKIATYTHTLDPECIASFVCNICNNPCLCPPPEWVTAYFSKDGLPDNIYRAVLNWSYVPDATSYTVEYKLSTEPEWNVIASSHLYTSFSSFITELTEDEMEFDFRVRANCEGCSSAYITTSTDLEKCFPPEALTWHQDTLTLTWVSDAGLTADNFKVEYKLESESTYILITPVITEVSPGFYSANLWSIPYIPNVIYDFSVKRVCEHGESEKADGCAVTCGVAIQSDPSVVLDMTTATYSWIGITGVVSYIISLYNNTDGVYVVSPTDVGLTTLYSITLEEGKSYTFTVKPVCGLGNQSCNDRSVSVEVPFYPEFNFYNANIYYCEEEGCVMSGTTVVRVDYPGVLNIGSFYSSTIGTYPLYEIVSSTTDEGTINIDVDSELDSCSDICTPAYIWYTANRYLCDNESCVSAGTETIRTYYADPLIIGRFYLSDDEDGYIYEPIATTTSATSVLVDTGTESTTCSVLCPLDYYYSAIRMVCSEVTVGVCEPEGSSVIVKSSYPYTLSIGSMYRDLLTGIDYLITAEVPKTATTIEVDHSTPIDCVDKCTSPYKYYDTTLSECINTICQNPVSGSVRSLTPLSIGGFYKDSADPTKVHEILNETTTINTNDVLPTLYTVCADGCQP